MQARTDTFLNVSARSFERQARLLQRLGYHGVTLDHAAKGLFEGGSLPPKPLCVTFDDGYANVAEFAHPVLRQLGWPATVFVPTKYVGACNKWDEQFGHPTLPIMDWRQLQELQAAGWEMSGHTRSHPKLGGMRDQDAEREILGGKDDLETKLGRPVTTFCYPFGSVGSMTPLICRKLGLRAACTTKSGLAGPASDPYLLPRVKIAYRDDVWGLLYRLILRPRLP